MKKKIFFGWWILIATLIIVMFAYGVRSGFNIFFKSIYAEFGWSRGVLGGAYFLSGFLGIIALPLAGWAIDKFGSRVIIILTTIIVGGSFLFIPLIASARGFYIIYSSLISVGINPILGLSVQIVMAKWFRRHLCKAMSIISLGSVYRV